jgi:aldehyde:ferredoxin oxidoreductase
LDASGLEGKDIFETDEKLRKRYGEEGIDDWVSIAAIGPAGEKQVRFACIVNDRGHVAASGGGGAVMGSKNLKAIVVHGDRGVPIHPKDRESFLQCARQWRDEAKHTAMGKLVDQCGSLGFFTPYHSRGWVPVKNLTTNIFPKEKYFDGEYVRKKLHRMQPRSCHGCTFHHCHVVEVVRGPYRGTIGEEPEYEAMVSYGPVIGNKDPAGAIVLGNETDWLGLDMNEAGWLIAWVMECYEEGVFTSKDTDNLEMTWGNIESARQLLRKIAHKEGIGSLLADGVMRAAVKIGGRAGEKAIYTKKGNTPRSHDHRTIWNTIIDTVTSSMGTDEASALLSPPEALGLPADTNRGSAEGAALINAATAKLGNKHLVDSMILCYLNTYGASKKDLLSHLTAATGWPPEEFDQFGFMVNNLYRAFGIRHGHTPEMDEPSSRYGSTSLAGQGKGKSLLTEWQEARRVYYESMGWDGESGKPLPETLRKLGLDFVISHIWG